MRTSSWHFAPGRGITQHQHVRQVARFRGTKNKYFQARSQSPIMLSFAKSAWTLPLYRTTGSRTSVVQRPRLARSPRTTGTFSKRSKCAMASATSGKLTFYDSGKLVNDIQKAPPFRCAKQSCIHSCELMHVHVPLCYLCDLCQPSKASCPSKS